VLHWFLLIVLISFDAFAAAPTATTSTPTSVTASSATLRGIGNPNGAAAAGWFRYASTDPGTCNDSFGTRAPASGGDSLGSGTSPVAYSEAITGLTAGTPYYYCAIAQNSAGTGFGSVISFTPDDPPAVDSTYPANGAIGVAAYARITITFTEGVTVHSWFAISCDSSGTHTAAEGGGTITYTLNPDTDFASGELCTVSIYSEGVADIYVYDPPDTMVDDHVFSFTVGPHPDSIFVDGFESGDTSFWSAIAP
jgi:Bacterial Ig-like domain